MNRRGRMDKRIRSMDEKRRSMDKDGRSMDKKGLELAINTIVILILAILILAALVLFFTGSFSTFYDKIRGYSSYSNVDTVVKGCNVLADTEAQYGYCCEKKTVKYFNEGEKDEGEFSCLEISNQDFGNKVRRLNCEGISC